MAPMGTDRLIELLLDEIKNVNTHVAKLETVVAGLSASLEVSRESKRLQIDNIVQDIHGLRGDLKDLAKQHQEMGEQLAKQTGSAAIPLSIVGFITAVVVAILQATG